MSSAGETFFTSIGCMDGRCQEAVELFGQDRFGAEYPDTITEPGLVGILAKQPVDERLLKSLQEKLGISLNVHHSKGILIYGHAECAALDGVSDEEHKENVLKAASVIRSLVDRRSVPVIPLFVERSQDNYMSDWEAKEIHI